MINNGLAPPNPANVIDYAIHWEDEVYVRNVGCPPGWPAGNPGDPCASPGAATEVELATSGPVPLLLTHDTSAVTVNGGYLVGSLRSYDSSSITTIGGRVNSVETYDTSTFNMYGSEILHVLAYDFSAVTVKQGIVHFAMAAYDASTVTIEGGGITGLYASHTSTVEIEMDPEPGPTGWEGGVFSLSAGGSSTVTMNGGLMLALYASGFSTVTINDGHVCPFLPADDDSTVAISGIFVLPDWPYFDTRDSSSVGIEGGEICATLRVQDSSTITIAGTDFAVDGSPVPYGDLTALTGTLTGTLASGDPINSDFSQGGGSYTGTITLVPPPPIPVDVDIKPGSCPNSWNRESKGMLPVAILGREDFDVTQIDVSSITIGRADGTGGSVGPNEGPPGPHSVFEDVGTPFEGEVCHCHEAEGDGILDLSMKFKTRDVADLLPVDDPNGAFVPLVVSGTLLDGTRFASSSDCVWLAPPGRRLVR
jgi:hypothetical protein